jgi:hypothetical protein
VHSAAGRRRAVYSPALSDKAVRTIYRIKKALKKPMTEIADNLIQQSLKAVDKDVICEICIGDKNNLCEECSLNERS